MKITILTVFLVLTLISGHAFSQDVMIDSTGNVTTGSSNANSNLEVNGSTGEDGIVGSTTDASRSGVYGINNSNNNYGTLGHGSYGVYGNSGTGYAGYFDGNTRVNGNLNVTGNISGTITETDPSVNALGKASLSCTNGQVAKYSGGTWSCAADIDTDTKRSEAEVEAFITNGPIDLATGSTIGGVAIADVNQTSGGAAYAGVAVVATSGGDYTNPVTAMNDINIWCGAPSASNRCILKIMPGVYNIGASSLYMLSYVDIEGSGENVTKITGSVDNPSWSVISLSLVYGADNAELRSLTIENTSSGNQTVGVINSSVSPRISNVTVIAANGIATIGIYDDASSAIINNVSVDAMGGNGIGLWNENTCAVEVTGSRFKGALNSVTASPGSKTLMAASKLDGAVSAPSNTISCFSVYDASFGAVTCP